MSDVFETLFGSKTRARLLRLFILNPEKSFTTEEIAEKAILLRSHLLREARQLVKIKLLTERTKAGKSLFSVNPTFPFFSELRTLFVRPDSSVYEVLFKKIQAIGDVRLLLVSGIFLNHHKSKADMILVVNNPSRAKLKSAIGYIEAEIGREIRFVIMNGEELQYRLNMMDRFLLEFLENPVREIVNKVPELKRFVAGLRR
ncbi:MAG: hypothetical protein IPL87_03930 [Candidatus Moraniibacteriota bacterium]|nr:MAG: hypothetical protein IPL87_03930 [Candidatus Moranbacteria bacterium]